MALFCDLLFRCVMFRCVMLCVVLLSSSILKNHSKPFRMQLHHKANMILNVLSINTLFFNTYFFHFLLSYTLSKTTIIMTQLKTQRETRYCWALGKGSFKTNKWTIFLQTEATFPYCNCLIKMARIVEFGSTSVVNSRQRLGCLPFWVYVKVGYSFKQKTDSLVNNKKKNIC